MNEAEYDKWMAEHKHVLDDPKEDERERRAGVWILTAVGVVLLLAVLAVLNGPSSAYEDEPSDCDPSLDQPC